MSATTSVSRKFRLATALAAAVVAAAIAPVFGLGATPAQAAGDVCDICSVNFDIALCENLGGWPYDSTLEAAPPAVSGGGGPAQPAPAQPAPAQPAPAQPAPAQPVTGGTSGTSKSSGNQTQTGTEVAAVVATAPSAPAALAHAVTGRELTLTWTTPTDGGSPLTGYRLVLNEGTPIDLPADATTYSVKLGAGTYDVVLLATNAIGQSAPTAAVAGIVIAGASPSTTPQPEKTAITGSSASASSSTSAIGGIVIGGVVLAGVGLLAWWWLRRRGATTSEQ